MNHQETAKLLAVMNTVWKDNTNADADAQTIAYQMALEDVSYQDGSEAIKRCLKELVFFPKPAEIIERLPHAASALAIGEASRHGPRSAYDMGYLPRPTGPVPYELPGVPTLADILAREAGASKQADDLGSLTRPLTGPNSRPVTALEPVAISERKKAS